MSIEELEIKKHELITELSLMWLKEIEKSIKERYIRWIVIISDLELNENIDTDIFKLEAQIEKFKLKYES